jgi:hypothetical protein
MRRLRQENGRLEFDKVLSGLQGRSEALLMKMQPNAKMRKDVLASAQRR